MRFRYRNCLLGSAARVLGLLNALLLHPILDLILDMAAALLDTGLLMTMFRVEFPAARSTRLRWFLTGSAGMEIVLVIPMLRHA